MATKLPPVSIGIPFFNAERYLLDAIRSVFAQTHQDWELILMDDGSTDSSLEIARSIRDPRVRVFSDGENRRLASRLNEIHALAKFDFVARMDADDLMAPDRIQKQLEFLVDNHDIDLVTAGVCSITNDSLPYGMRVPSAGHKVTPYSVLIGAHGIVHAAITGRKTWFMRNPYDPKDARAQDYKLWVRGTLRNDLAIGFIPEPLYYYREAGEATPQKILAGHRLGREVIRSNGPRLVGMRATAYLLGRSYMKSLIAQLAVLVGGFHHIVRARSSSADAGAMEVVRGLIDGLLKVPVPVEGAVE